jgi:hypothetical protein
MQLEREVSKEFLLRQVDGLRDIARRSRRLAEIMDEHEQRCLNQHADELEESAQRIEGQAANAKTGVVLKSAFLASES